MRQGIVSDDPTISRARRWRVRTAELVVGFTANKAQEYLFDYLLYPFVIFKLGLWRGGLVMALLSLVSCLLLLRFYDRLKRDWLGIEAVKGLKDYAGQSRFRRMAAWLLQRGEPVACLFLSIKFDPFITTLYLRRGSYNGMTRRDWKIFVASWLIGNVYWTFVCFGGVSALVWLWRKLS
jgi:hypothetical protein